MRGYASWQLGDRDAARAAFEASLEAGRAREADYEIAISLVALARLDRDEGDDGRRGRRATPRPGPFSTGSASSRFPTTRCSSGRDRPARGYVGVTAFDTADAAPVPATFFAATLNV